METALYRFVVVLGLLVIVLTILSTYLELTIRRLQKKLLESRSESGPRESLMEDSASFLWTVVANVSGGDWTKQAPEWQQAAKRARDEFHGRKKHHTYADRAMRDAVLIMEAVNYLREDEGELVTICCDNPEPETAKDNCAIECVGLWTNWHEKRFYGITVQNALNDAVAARRAFYDKFFSSPTVRYEGENKPDQNNDGGNR